jgi:hypothetical protein
MPHEPVPARFLCKTLFRTVAGLWVRHSQPPLHMVAVLAALPWIVLPSMTAGLS